MSNMMVLLNGTPGGVDGTEVTGDITLKNLMNNYLESGNGSNGCKPNANYLSINRIPIIIPICLRMKPGYSASNIRITTSYNLTYHAGILGGSNIIYAYTRQPTDIYSNSEAINDYASSNPGALYDNNNGREMGISDSKNAMLLIGVIVNSAATSIPSNSTLFQISYQEDKV